MGGDAPYLDNSELLGKSITLLPNEINPFEVKSLIRRSRRIVELDEDTKTVGETEDFKGFSISKDIDFFDFDDTHTQSLMVETGTELSNSLDADASVSASYAGISAEGSVKYSYQTALSASKYYGVVSMNHLAFNLALQLRRGKVDLEDGFVESAEELPEWPTDGKAPTQKIYDQYKAFFHTWGTYVIRSCDFGARYQLKIESHISESSSKEKMAAHIKAEYNGICSLKAEAGVEKSDEYKKYTKVRKFDAKVIGGNSGKNVKLSSAPSDSEKFNDWAETITDSTANAPFTFGVKSLGDIVKECKDLDKNTRNALSGRLNNALTYFNSFRIAQGSVELKDPYISNGTYEFKFIGPPGLEIHASAKKGKNYNVSVESDPKAPASFKIHCQKDSSTPFRIKASTGVLAYVKIFAPSGPLGFYSSNSSGDLVAIKLENGPTIKYLGDIGANPFRDDFNEEALKPYNIGPLGKE